MKKLDTRGIAHEMAMVGFVVIFAISGVAYMVASRAAVCEPVSSATSSANLVPTSSAVSSAECEPVSSATSAPVQASSTLTPTPEPAPAPAPVATPAPVPAPAPAAAVPDSAPSPSAAKPANSLSKMAGSCIIKNNITRKGKVATNKPQVTIYNKGNQPFNPAIAYTATKLIGRNNVTIERKAISSNLLQPGQSVTKQLGAIQSSTSKQTISYGLLIKSNSPQYTCSGKFISTSKSPSTY